MNKNETKFINDVDGVSTDSVGAGTGGVHFGEV
jgi:hypothetical protein